MLAKLDSPNARDLEFLVSWMKSPCEGKVYLLGLDSDIWENPNKPDLVALRTRDTGDTFTRIVTDVLLQRYHHLIEHYFTVCILSSSGRYIVAHNVQRPKFNGAHHESNTVTYSQKGVLRFTRAITTVLASLLPISSTVALFFIHSMLKRLVAIGAFNAIFWLSLALLTNGRMIDIFGVTSA